MNWDEGNEEHIIERHGIYPDEVEQVFHNGAYVMRVGDRYRAFGADDAGQYLHIVCELCDQRVRVISARVMTVRERRFYERNR